MEWTRITDPDEAPRLFPAWFSGRMLRGRGAFGLLLTTGDVMRITSVLAMHHASDGTVLIDVLLDHAGPPEGVDQAWRTKHFLGAPVPGASMATVNLAHIVTAVEFVVAELVEAANDEAGQVGEEVAGLGRLPETAVLEVG